MLVTNPDNPTGSVLRRSIIKEIVDMANEYGTVLVSDEIYDEIVYNGASFTSVGRLARGMPHVILNGASKDFDATGLRVGYAAIPEQDRTSQEMKQAFRNLASLRISANRPAQLAFAEAMDDDAQHRTEIRKMVKGIEDRVNFAMKLLNENRHLETVEPNGAFYIFPRIHVKDLKVKDDREFARKLLMEECVWVVRGSGFGSPDHFRMIALPPKATLELAIGRINRFCRRHVR
jgi:alanine-synthesizing transaminase